MAFVSFQNVSKVYKTGEVTIEALHDVNFEIEKGEYIGRNGLSDHRKSISGWRRSLSI